jgi:hypothetical protein
MPSRDGMFWPIYIYLTASVVVAGSAAFKVGWGTALSIAMASMLSLVAGGRLKASLRWGDKAQKNGGSVVAILIVGLAQWLATNFSVWLVRELCRRRSLVLDRLFHRPDLHDQEAGRATENAGTCEPGG